MTVTTPSTSTAEESAALEARTSTPRAPAVPWRLLGAILAGSLVALLYYTIDRSRAFIVHGPPDPLSPFASARIDYFWRVGYGLFLGTIATGAWWQLIGARAEAGFRLLVKLIVPSAILGTVLSLIFP